jgi:hypothetical protein
LEIKLTGEADADIAELLQTIEATISPHLVSYGQQPFEVLNELLQTFPNKIYVIEKVTSGQFSKQMINPKLLYLERIKKENEGGVLFTFSSSKALQDQAEFSGSIVFECEGYIENQKIYTHKIIIPNRGPEIIDYAILLGKLVNLLKLVRCNL